ncbi:hypothetical protein EJB05_30289, partial [Eragrostis curvula]
MDRIVTTKRRRADVHGDFLEEARALVATAVLRVSDLISRLPDCVLGRIVSLLDTEEGARTALLSRRWRYVWLSSPLNLNDRLRGFYCDHHRLQVISRILDVHHGSARRLSLRSLNLPTSIARFDGWLRLPLFDALEELVLRFGIDAHQPHQPELPASTLRFASLRVLDLDNCAFPATGAGAPPAFPCLTHLSLRRVCIAEELLLGMISRSPGIENMLLDTNSGHRRLCLPSLPRLRCLAVMVSQTLIRKREIEMEELVVEDAPSLERLLLHEVQYGPSVRIKDATKLKMLGYLATGFPVIELGNSVFKGMVLVSLVSRFSTVTILGLEMPEPNLEVVIGYLTCFPCLEKLHIKLIEYAQKNLNPALHLDPSAPIECLDRSLKTIVLQSYEGLETHVKFARFFVERAKVLEVMKFCSIRDCATRWLRTQFRLLNIENRASRYAEFPFVHQYDWPERFWVDGGFSSDDPFMESV